MMRVHQAIPILGLFAALALGLAHAAPARPRSSADAKPEMFPDGLFYDFGKLPHGVVRRHRFRIVNNTDLPMRVESVQNTMGVGQARYVGPIDLRPGEEGEIEITVNTNRFVGVRTSMTYVYVGYREFRFGIQAESEREQLPERSGQ